MRVLRGRADGRGADRRVTVAMLAGAGDRGEPAVRVWTPQRQVAFGRRDAHEPGYETARRIAEDRGFAPVERSVGGRAVAYTGSTLAFAHAIPIGDMRAGLDERYARATDRLQGALEAVGVPADRGEPENSFCPGAHSLSCRGKIVGIAQRIQSNAALVSGVVIVDGHEAIAGVLDPIYGALSVPFDPDAVGSVARAGGRVGAVAGEVEAALVGDLDARIERVDRKP